MLSRTAENLYWLARYVERAEYLARTIEATLRVTALPNTYIGKTNEWDSALLTAGVSASFYEIHEEANEHNVVDYLSFSPANPSSIKNCIENARLNSRSVRTALTSEMWDNINSAWIDLQEVWGKGTRTREELAVVRDNNLVISGGDHRVRRPRHRVSDRVQLLHKRRAGLLIGTGGAAEGVEVCFREEAWRRHDHALGAVVGGSDTDELIDVLRSAEEAHVVAGHHSTLAVAHQVHLFGSGRGTNGIHERRQFPG